MGKKSNDDEPQPLELSQGEAVKMLVVQRTDLGYKAVINHRWWGVLHQNDIRTAIRTGMKLDGYIKRIRDDGKIDLSLEPPGHRRAAPLASRIMTKLESNGGTLGLSDSSPAELIEMHFGVSKRVFKMAIGQLYKERKIRIESDAIYLADPNQPHKARKPAAKKSDNYQARSERRGSSERQSSSERRSPSAKPAETEQPAAKPAKKKVWKNNRPKTERTLT